MIKLFISGFPLEMDEMVIAKLVSPHGDISTLKIVRDKKTRICKGYAFLEMVSEKLYGLPLLVDHLFVPLPERSPYPKLKASSANASNTITGQHHRSYHKLNNIPLPGYHGYIAVPAPSPSELTVVCKPSNRPSSGRQTDHLQAIDKMFTNKKFKDFFQKNVAAL